MPRDVAYVMLPVRIGEDLLPQGAGLFEIHCEEPGQTPTKGGVSSSLTFGNLTQVEIGITQPLLVLHPLGLVWSLLVLKGSDRAWIVWTEPLVVVVPRTVPLEVGNWDGRLVDWELLVVHTEAVSVSVGVGK